MGSLTSSSISMKFLILSACLAVSQAGVLISTAPAHHFQAATAPADHFLAATAPASHFQAATAPADHFLAATAPADFFLQAVAPADHFSAQKLSAPVEQFPAAAHAAAYTAPNLAPYASYYTVKGAALGGVPAPIPGAA